MHLVCIQLGWYREFQDIKIGIKTASKHNNLLLGIYMYVDTDKIIRRTITKKKKKKYMGTSLDTIK